MSSLVKCSMNRIAPLVRTNITQKATFLSGPPKYPTSFVSKLTVGGGMCLTIVAPMFWIMANIKHYKNPGGVAEDAE